MDVVSPLRQINAAGEAIIKNAETLYLISYLDPDKIWTVGWGHTLGVVQGMSITPEQAEGFLDQDLRTAEAGVTRFTTVPLNDNQFSVLVSFTFNVGVEDFKTSTLLRLLNQGFYEQIPPQMMRWNKSRSGEVLGGLSRRRVAEGVLWNTPVVASALEQSA